MEYRDPARPYSMTQIRAFYSECDFVYYLHYVRGYKGKYASPAWLGNLVHLVLQQAYHHIPLLEAHRRAWQRACGPILRELQAWYLLDEEHQQSGRPNTAARKRWEEEHSEYGELARLIEAYRDEYLSEEYTWAKSVTLAEYYRWSYALTLLPRERLLLANVSLVEGQPLFDENGVLIERFAAEHAYEDHYTNLKGTLGGLPIIGRPDYVAVDPQGTLWIADAKTLPAHQMSPEDIREDAQLNLYAELLLQEGKRAVDQETYIGHVYYTRADPLSTEEYKRTGRRPVPGVEQVWAHPSPQAIPRLTKQLLRMDRRIQAGDFLPVRGIATGSMSPCPDCIMAFACQEHYNDYIKEYAL